MDRRIRKTRSAIIDALLRLSAKKSLSAISVRELAEEADIPRSTFYLHYHSINDVISEYLEEYTRDMSEFLKEDFTTLRHGNRQLFLSMLEYIWNHRQLAPLLFCEELAATSSRYIEAALHPLLMHRFQKQDAIQDEQLLHDMAFFSSQGSIALIMQWVHQDFPCSPDEMTDRIVDAIRAYTNYFVEMFPVKQN
ncbi:MAG: TetR/AcrR family transcriptional regulator [Eubacteriales bacterium]|nr:TetR/AcrR family transcriptional regulator [Eubacteriales bacterium]